MRTGARIDGFGLLLWVVAIAGASALAYWDWTATTEPVEEPDLVWIEFE